MGTTTGYVHRYETNSGRYSGSIVNKIPNGYGVMNYNSGAEYSGNWYDGKYHGRGDMKCSNGEKYMGEWYYGIYHGSGTLTLCNGEIRKGNFHNGSFSSGTIFKTDGRICECSNFCNLMLHGTGKLITDSYTYTGEFKYDKFDGNGEIKGVRVLGC